MGDIDQSGALDSDDQQSGTRVPDTTPRARRVLVALTTLLVVLIVAGLSLAARPGDLAIDEPITEDGYYALAVARSIADGSGVTIDGINATNGFQPLFTFLAAGAFVITPNDTWAIRVVLVLHWAIWVATAWLLSTILSEWMGVRGDRRRLVRVTTGLLFLGATYIIHVSFNGLETGLVLLGYVVLWRRFQVSSLERPRDAAALGALAGLTVLARIDAVFVVAALCLYLLVTRRTRSAVIVGATALAVSAPWWIYNYAEFGSLMPTSGQALFEFRPHSTARFRAVVSALGDVSVPWTFAGRFSGYAIGAVKIVAMATALLMAWRVPSPATPLSNETAQRSRAFAWIVVAAAGSVVLWCFFTSMAVHFYYRYFAPVALLAIVLAAATLGRHERGWRSVGLIGAASLSGLIGITSMAILWNRDLSDGNEWLLNQVPLVAETVPEGERVAAGQTGTLGFWREDVVNLDGKVNPDVLERQEDIAAYLDEQSIVWLCDWRNYVESYLGETPEAQGWSQFAERGRFGCWRREGGP